MKKEHKSINVSDEELEEAKHARVWGATTFNGRGDDEID